MLEIITLILLSAILGSLVSLIALLRHLRTHYALKKKPLSACVDQSQYTLRIKQANVLSSSVRCNQCQTTIKSTAKNPRVYCECGNIFVEGSESNLVIGAKDMESLEDNSEVSIRTFIIPKSGGE